MSKILKTLLSNDNPLFLMNVSLLERATGDAGVDARLVADIFQLAHGVLRKMGLDVRDTKLLELYSAFKVVMDRSDEELRDLLDSSSFVLYELDGEIISFNHKDVVEKLTNGGNPTDGAKRKLRAELVRRYAEHERSHKEMVYRLTREVGIMVEEDNISKQAMPNKEGKAMSQVPKVLAIGDIISDDFIDMSMDHIKVTKDEEGYEWAAMELGGKIPYVEVERVDAVECSPNAAVSMARLGLDVSLMSWIGDDEIGKDMIKYLESENVKTDNIAVEEGMKSNFHYVLRYGADRTKLQRFEDYSYQWQDPSEKPDWIYLGVLGEKTWPLHEAILDYLNRNPEIKLVFQPGMYHLEWGAEKMAEFYNRAEIVVMNREEAARVTGRSRENIVDLINGMHDLGVTDVAVTDGPAGAYASVGQGVKFMPIYPDIKPPYDRTGAGDAFASTLTAALILGESLETALRWAPINSMVVSQYLGAQKGLLTREQLQEYLDNAPEDYHPSEFHG